MLMPTPHAVLQILDKKASDLDLSFKPAKCVSYPFNGTKIISQGISLSNRSIVGGETTFFGVSLLMCH